MLNCGFLTVSIRIATRFYFQRSFHTASIQGILGPYPDGLRNQNLASLRKLPLHIVLSLRIERDSRSFRESQLNWQVFITGGVILDSDTAYVLGNGPSLADVDLKKLDSSASFGMNAAYRFWYEIDWFPDHYVCLDPVVISSHSLKIRQLIEESKIKYFFLEGSFFQEYPEYVADPRILSLDQVVEQRFKNRGKNLGHHRIVHPAFEFADEKLITTGAWAVRYAAFMGWTSVTTLGIDLRYIEVLPEAEELDGIKLRIKRTPKRNPNYFFEGYQLAGDEYQVPNPSVHDKNLHISSFEDVARDVADGNIQAMISNSSASSVLAQRHIFPFREMEIEADLHSVVIPMTLAETDALLKNFRLWTHAGHLPFFGLSPKVRPQLIVVLNKKSLRNMRKIKSAFYRAKLTRFFSGLSVTALDLKKSDDLYLSSKPNFKTPFGWKTGPANLFFKSMDISRRYGGFTYVMETDCVAVSPNWLGELNKICRNYSRSWMIGSVYRGNRKIDRRFLRHINGSSIYNVGSDEFYHYLMSFWRDGFFQLSKKHPSINYDLVMDQSLQLAIDHQDKVKPMNKAWQTYQHSAHNFFLTEKIVNVSGDDLPDGGVEAFLRKMPSAIVIHNRAISEAIFRERLT